MIALTMARTNLRYPTSREGKSLFTVLAGVLFSSHPLSPPPPQNFLARAISAAPPQQLLPHFLQKVLKLYQNIPKGPGNVFPTFEFSGRRVPPQTGNPKKAAARELNPRGGLEHDHNTNDHKRLFFLIHLFVTHRYIY